MPVQLSAEAADLRLSFQAQQGSQRLFHGLALGLQTRCAKRVPHQLIVNHDVRSHRCVFLLLMIHIPVEAEVGLARAGTSQLAAKTGGPALPAATYIV